MIYLKRAIGIVLFWVVTTTGSAQSELKITASFENKSLKEVFEQLAKEYNLKFAYDSYEMSKYAGSWQFDSKSTDEVMNELLSQFGLKHQWYESTLIIYYDGLIPEKNGEVKPVKDVITLKGVVRDAFSGELLPYAVLSSSESDASAVTDLNGYFSFDLLFDENDTIKVFFVGYEVSSIPMNIINPDRPLHVRLSPARNYLPDVLIESTGIHLVSSPGDPGLHVLNPSVIGATQGTGESDIMRSAQLMPGITATRESSNGLYIRGSNNDQTLLTMDGFNLYHQDHFFGAFTAINSNAVKSMSIYKGIPDARYGGRVGGVVEIAGREGNLNTRLTQVDVSPLSVGIVFEAPLDTLAKGSVFISGRRAFTDILYTPTYRGLFNTTYSAAVSSGDNNRVEAFGEQVPDFYFQDVNVKFSYRPDEKNAFHLSLFSSHDELFVQYADTLNSELVDKRDIKYMDESTKKNVGVSARWTRRWNDHWETLVSAGFSRFTGEYFSADSIRNSFFQIDSLRFNSEGTVLVDYDVRLETSANFQTFKAVGGFQLNAISSEVSVNEQGRILADSTDNGNIASCYASFTNGKSDKLEIKPGFRLNYFSLTKNFYPEWRLAFKYHLIKELLSLKFSGGRVNQFIQRTRDQSLYQNTPDYWQLASTGSVPVLQSDQFMAGAVLNLAGITLDIEGYARHNEGAVTSSWLLTNTNELYQGEADIYGVDILFLKDYKRHHFIAGYSYMSANADYPKTGLYDVPLNFWIEHEVKLNYELRLRQWDFTAFWVYGSGAPFTPLAGSWMMELPDGTFREIPVYGKFNSARLPAYHRLDVAVTWHKSFNRASFSATASAFNLYNQMNIRNVQYIVLNNYDDAGRINIGKRSTGMLGFLPSINLKLKF